MRHRMRRMLVAMGGGAVWTNPTQSIDGLLPITWGEADKLTGLNNGDLVTTFTDLSGNGNSPTWANNTYKPSYITNVVNGKPVIRNGSNKFLRKPFAITAPAHLFMVMKVDTFAASKHLFNGGVSSKMCIATHSADPNYVCLSGTQFPNIPELETRYCLVTIALYPDAGSISHVRVNGYLRDARAVVGGNVGGITLLNNINEGTTGSPNSCAAFLMYPGVLSASSEAKVEKYFSDKYALNIKPNPTATVTGTKIIKAHAGSDWYGRPTARVVNGVAVMVYRRGSAHGASDGELHIRFSDDYGDTWTEEDTTLLGAAVTGFPMTIPVIGAGESYLTVAPNGDLVLSLFQNNNAHTGTYLSLSSDDGETWSAPALIDFAGTVNDADIYMSDDSFVADDGVLYAGARDFTGAAKVIFLNSLDNGATWNYVSDIAVGINGSEVGLEYLGTNTIVAIIRTGSDTYRAYSYDMGATWGKLGMVSQMFGSQSGRHRVYTEDHLQGNANWWLDTRLITCGFYILGTRVNSIWLSNDGGFGWTQPVVLDAAYADAGYSDVFWNPVRSEYVIVSYRGTTDVADIVQYNVSVNWNDV